MFRPAASARRLLLFLAPVLCLVLGSIEARATAYTWTGLGGDDNWVTLDNWTGGSSYPGGEGLDIDSAEFAATTGGLSTVIGANVSLTRITYSAAGYSLQIDGFTRFLEGMFASTETAPTLQLNGTLYIGGDSTLQSLNGAGTVNAHLAPVNLTVTGTGGVFSGNLQDATGQVSLTVGDGTTEASQTLSGPGGAAYAGATLVQANATLTSANTNALSASSDHTVNGSLVLAGGANSIGGLAGSGTVALGANTLSVSGSGTFDGTITGSGELVKNGAGTLTFSESSISDYTGATYVNAGTLRVDGSIDSDVTVLTGATLTGDGIVGSITLENGSQLAPVGCLDGNNLTWNAGATMVFELGVDAPTLDLLGTLYKGGTGNYVFNFIDAGAEMNETYTLINFSDTDFLSASAFSFINNSGLTGIFSLTENSLEFTVVPEPGTSLLALAGLATVLLRRRRN